MEPWSRRRVLGALGLGALAPLFGGCRAPASTVAPRAPTPELTTQLVEVVRRLGRSLADPRAHLALHHRGRVVVDGNGVELDRWIDATLWLSGGPVGRRVERGVRDLSADGIARAAAALAAEGSGGDASAGVAAPEPAAAGAPTPARAIVDARRASDAAWVAAIQACWRRARDHGDSRIVHRDAVLEIDDADLLHVSLAAVTRERRRRAGAAVRFLAVGRAGLGAEVVARVDAGGLEVAALPDEALAGAAARALASFTAQPLAAGVHAVVLAPAVVAALIGRGLLPALRADRWLTGESALAGARGQRFGAPGLEVVDDAGAGGPGGRRFDDEGTAPRRIALLASGRIGEPLSCRASAAALGLSPSGHAVRDAGGALVPAASAVAIGAGELDDDGLLAALGRGFVLEGPLAGGGDPRRLDFTLAIARAHEVERGRLTGRLHGPVVLRGRLPELLAGVVGRGRARETSLEGGAAIAAPSLITRGALIELAR